MNEGRGQKHAFGPSEGERFDVVVVGAGSAGCAVAGRLSEDPSLKVLLLEAGGSDDVLEVQVPAGLYKVWRTRRDWNYMTEPQPGSAAGGCSGRAASCSGAPRRSTP